jgi:hypothetical protein
MELINLKSISNFQMRRVARLSPFKVVKIKSDDSQQNAIFNITDSKGLGIASCGVDYDAAIWICNAMNNYAKNIHLER